MISHEELQRRLQQPSSTDPEDRPRCENCGSVSLVPRQRDDPRGDGTGEEDVDAPYQCEVCREFVEGSA